jgi:hypothetical protein
MNAATAGVRFVAMAKLVKGGPQVVPAAKGTG